MESLTTGSYGFGSLGFSRIVKLSICLVPSCICEYCSYVFVLNEISEDAVRDTQLIPTVSLYSKAKRSRLEAHTAIIDHGFLILFKTRAPAVIKETHELSCLLLVQRYNVLWLKGVTVTHCYLDSRSRYAQMPKILRRTAFTAL